VHRQRAGDDALLDERLAHQPLRQAGALAMRQHPAHRITAEQIENHVQIIVAPLGRPEQLGDVPGPDLVRPRGHELRLDVLRMPQLVASFADLGRSVEQAVHRANRA
jgi:hypothetical protein